MINSKGEYMPELRCHMCGKPLTYEELDKQKFVFTATASGMNLMLCDRDYERVLHIFEKGETHARLHDKTDSNTVL